ncbi:hypothetical protein MMC07_003446 [Pseudocyphellaria aurata]|nr:hypothetical protein [Pseudocyphellaria aurata]
MLIVTPPPKPPHQLLAGLVNGDNARQPASQNMEDLMLEVEDLFERQLRIESLLSMSRKLQGELRLRLKSSPQSMLPSHNYVLPTGQERGIYLALEVGGSTLRVALVELHGRSVKQERLRVRRIECSPIDANVRQLRELAFFDWIAARIADMLAMEVNTKMDEPLRMGIAWSFPIDQTSIRSGNVLGMGKGFHCSQFVQGHDLGEIIEQACQRAHLNIRLDAIVNDSSATLLSNAYLDPSTRLAAILGTGINAAVHLPIAALHPSKFGPRLMPRSSEATHVLVNTEFSMFGKSIWPTTRWDEKLNTSHLLPDYQPLEYLIAGGYMGEIVRLILVEATTGAGLFGGHLPPSLLSEYALDTRTLAAIEQDHSASLVSSCILFQERHPSSNPPLYSDMRFIRQVTRSVSRRSSAYFTAGMHALSSLLEDLGGSEPLHDGANHIGIGCDGSVINKYPGYMARCQDLMDQLIGLEGGQVRRRVVLEKTIDSAVVGAGVAGAMAARRDG